MQNQIINVRVDMSQWVLSFWPKYTKIGCNLNQQNSKWKIRWCCKFSSQFKLKCGMNNNFVNFIIKGLSDGTDDHTDNEIQADILDE